MIGSIEIFRAGLDLDSRLDGSANVVPIGLPHLAEERFLCLREVVYKSAVGGRLGSVRVSSKDRGIVRGNDHVSSDRAEMFQGAVQERPFLFHGQIRFPRYRLYPEPAPPEPRFPHERVGQNTTEFAGFVGPAAPSVI